MSSIRGGFEDVSELYFNGYSVEEIAIITGFNVFAVIEAIEFIKKTSERD